jgi:hypothetical protein
MTPFVHAAGDAHAVPAAHSVHAPAPSQTPPAQCVPTGALLATHSGPPAAQCTFPLVHASPVLHAAPSTQGFAAHAPFG